MAASLVTQVRTAIEVPRWALGFYLRHFPLIFGVSLIPAAERFASQLWNTPQPAMEILTACARLVLLILVVRLAITRDPAVARSGEDGIGARVWRFYRLHWPSIIVQLLLLTAAWAVFDLLPEQVIVRWVPESGLPLYWAILLAVKNPTVIAFTFVWMVGLARQPLRWAAERRAERLPSTGSPTRS